MSLTVIAIDKLHVGGVTGRLGFHALHGGVHGGVEQS